MIHKIQCHAERCRYRLHALTMKIHAETCTDIDAVNMHGRGDTPYKHALKDMQSRDMQICTLITFI
jgi:hypothetical protein